MQQIQSALNTISQDQLDALVGLHNRFLSGRIGGRRAYLENVNMNGLSLQGKNLTQAHFSGCNMEGMDLSSANFREAALYACDLSHSNLFETVFVRSDLRGARIENANLKSADLENADLRKGGIAKPGEFNAQTKAVNFKGADLSGAKLSGSMASHADFSDATLAGANMEQADLSGASLEGANLSNANIDGAQLIGANVNSAILTGVPVSHFKRMGIDLSGALTDENNGTPVGDLAEPLPHLLEQHREWLKSRGEKGQQLDLSNVDMRLLHSLKQEHMTAIRAVGAKFIDMNLYKINLQSAVVDSSDFRNCDMVEADLRGSSFIGCNFSHADMSSVNGTALNLGTAGTSRFKPCDFSQGRLRYAKLSCAQFKDALFVGADLSYADFSGADLRGCNFSGAVLNQTNLDDALTDGAKFDHDDSKPVFNLNFVDQDDT